MVRGAGLLAESFLGITGDSLGVLRVHRRLEVATDVAVQRQTASAGEMAVALS
jgi:hypothetical protein